MSNFKFRRGEKPPFRRPCVQAPEVQHYHQDSTWGSRQKFCYHLIFTEISSPVRRVHVSKWFFAAFTFVHAGYLAQLYDERYLGTSKHSSSFTLTRAGAKTRSKNKELNAGLLLAIKIKASLSCTNDWFSV